MMSAGMINFLAASLLVATRIMMAINSPTNFGFIDVYWVEKWSSVVKLVKVIYVDDSLVVEPYLKGFPLSIYFDSLYSSVSIFGSCKTKASGLVILGNRHIVNSFVVEPFHQSDCSHCFGEVWACVRPDTYR